jgi:predicted amidohydrolase
MKMSDDAADLFCAIFDSFEAERLDPHDVNDWLTDDQVMDISSFTEGQVIETGTLEEAPVWESIKDAEDPDRRRFAYLQGIDNALLHANPQTASHDAAGLTAISTRYAETGRFNTDEVEGALLPRFAFPNDDDHLAVERLADALVSVVRVPGAAWSATEHASIPARSDFGRPSREQGVVFGCVPFLDNLDELDWSVREDGAGCFFRGALIASPAVQARITAVLAALDRSPAAVGVIPEVCLTNEVLGWWRDTIIATPPPRDSQIRWLFVGTGPVGDAEPPLNSGFLLDRLTGAVLARQDKLSPFTLKRDQISSWGLEPYLGGGIETAREDITRGSKITVLETRLGRMSVLICEDLARTMTVGPPLRDHGVSLVICPVFSEVIALHHWEHAKAKEYAAQVGAQVIVANSRAVGCAQGFEEFGTAIAHSPFDTDIAETRSCEDVALIRLSDEAAIRMDSAAVNPGPPQG